MDSPVRYFTITHIPVIVYKSLKFPDGYHCSTCGKHYALRRAFQHHKNLIHSNRPIIRCSKCPFTTLFPENLRRHYARHLCRRSAYIPRRTISTSKKRQACEYWNSSTATTPKKREFVERTFRLTPNTQSRIFRKKNAFTTAKKRLFRLEGGGRPVDEFWAKIEGPLLQRFEERRDLGCIVHKRHLINFVHQICAELDINIALEGEKRKWGNPGKLIRLRIDRFCKKHKIRMKKASRQLHKKPKVPNIADSNMNGDI